MQFVRRVAARVRVEDEVGLPLRTAHRDAPVPGRVEVRDDGYREEAPLCEHMRRQVYPRAHAARAGEHRTQCERGVADADALTFGCTAVLCGGALAPDDAAAVAAVEERRRGASCFARACVCVVYNTRIVFFLKRRTLRLRAMVTEKRRGSFSG